MSKILILGGTNFIGRNLVEALIKVEGIEICLFNRGLSAPGLFPGVKFLRGDRETDDIEQVAGSKWDYVVDLSCYYPSALRTTLQNLSDLKAYIFISTCSVYDNQSNPSQYKTEDSPVLSCSVEQRIDRTTTTYGNRKSECERILHDFGIPSVILRPALVFGKYDPTDRLYYWLFQVRTKEQLIIPEKGERRFSTTYVQDLVAAITASIKPVDGCRTYNVISKPDTSIGQIISVAKTLLNQEPSLLNAEADLLHKYDISQWTDMPLWINGDHLTYSNQKMIEELGVNVTDFGSAVSKTIDYYHSLEWPEPSYGISEARRIELLNVLGYDRSSNK